jgi:hypothetical protein
MARTAAASGLRIEYGLIAAGIAVAIIAAANGRKLRRHSAANPCARHGPLRAGGRGGIAPNLANTSTYSRALTNFDTPRSGEIRVFPSQVATPALSRRVRFPVWDSNLPRRPGHQGPIA